MPGMFAPLALAHISFACALLTGGTASYDWPKEPPPDEMVLLPLGADFAGPPRLSLMSGRVAGTTDWLAGFVPGRRRLFLPLFPRDGAPPVGTTD